MTIYIQPGIIALFLLFGLACFLFGFVVGRPDKPKINGAPSPSYKIAVPEPISCETCRNYIELDTYHTDGCKKCITQGKYSGYKRGDRHA